MAVSGQVHFSPCSVCFSKDSPAVLSLSDTFSFSEYYMVDSAVGCVQEATHKTSFK